MMLPSKELLSEVFGKKVSYIDILKEDCDTHNTFKVIFQFDNIYYGGISGIEDENINIYELANKCKVWAYTKKFILNSEYYPLDNLQYSGGCLLADIRTSDTEYFNGKSESEAIFKACDYILKESSSKKIHWVLNNSKGIE